MATGRIGVTPTLGTRWSKAPAGGTTSLSGLDDNSVALVYSVGYEQVYRNGVLLSRGNDYTATSGNSITLTDATIAGDIIEVFANELVPLTDAISKGQFTAKGALLSATAASTPAVLTVGSNDQVLTADSSTATGLKWATPAAGGMTLLASGNLSGSSVSLNSISSAYNDLRLILRDVTISSTGEQTTLRFNNDSAVNYAYVYVNSGSQAWTSNNSSLIENIIEDTGTADSISIVNIFNYADTTVIKTGQSINHKDNGVVSPCVNFFSYHSTSAISSIQINVNGGVKTFTAGNYLLYGVK